MEQNEHGKLTAEELRFLEEYEVGVRFFRLCYADALRRARGMLAQELLLRRLPGPRC